MTRTGSVLLVLGLVIGMTTGATATEQVLVIGLDGAEWDVMLPMIEEGRLPTIERLMEDGLHGPLRSTLPLESPVAWTSMTTGTDPGTHGIYGFVELRNGSLTPLTADDVRADRVWDHVDGRSVVVNVPQTFPPADINGSLVASYLAVEDENYTHPPELQDRLDRIGYNREVLQDSFERGDEELFLTSLDATVEARTQAIELLLDEEDWELGFVAYTGLDRLQHYFWDARQDPGSEHHGAIEQQYERLDAEIGRILDHAGEDTTVMLVSDHGFTGLEDYVYLNDWLHQQGYLEIEGSSGSDPGLLQRLGLTQERAVDLLSDIGLLGPVQELFSMLGISPGRRLPTTGLEDIDMDASEAYAGNYGARIYVTVDDPERRQQVIDSIRSGLEALRDPDTGERPFRAVEPASAAYDAPGEDAPALVPVPAEGYRGVGFLGHGRTFGSPPAKSGTHARDGIYVISGSGAGTGRENASITDIAPTILAALGQDIPDSMQGRSLIGQDPADTEADP